MSNPMTEMLKQAVVNEFKKFNNPKYTDVKKAAEKYIYLQLSGIKSSEKINQNRLDSSKNELVAALAQATCSMDAYTKAIFLQNFETQCNEHIGQVKKVILANRENPFKLEELNIVDLDYKELKAEVAKIIWPLQINDAVAAGFNIPNLIVSNEPIVHAAGYIRLLFLKHCAPDLLDDVAENRLEKSRFALIYSLIETTRSLSAAQKVDYLQDFKSDYLTKLFKVKQSLLAKADYHSLYQNWDRQLDKVSLDFTLLRNEWYDLLNANLKNDLEALDVHASIAKITQTIQELNELKGFFIFDDVDQEQVFINKVNTKVEELKQNKAALALTGLVAAFNEMSTRADTAAFSESTLNNLLIQKCLPFGKFLIQSYANLGDSTIAKQLQEKIGQQHAGFINTYIELVLLENTLPAKIKTLQSVVATADPAKAMAKTVEVGEALVKCYSDNATPNQILQNIRDLAVVQGHSFNYSSKSLQNAALLAEIVESHYKRSSFDTQESKQSSAGILINQARVSTHVLVNLAAPSVAKKIDYTEQKYGAKAEKCLQSLLNPKTGFFETLSQLSTTIANAFKKLGTWLGIRSQPTVGAGSTGTMVASLAGSMQLIGEEFSAGKFNNHKASDILTGKGVQSIAIVNKANGPDLGSSDESTDEGLTRSESFSSTSDFDEQTEDTDATSSFGTSFGRN